MGTISTHQQQGDGQISKSDSRKINNLTLDSTAFVTINTIYAGNLIWINNETYISDIEKEIIKQIDQPYTMDTTKASLIFHIKPYIKKNIVQFQIYSGNKNLDQVGGIIKEHRIKGENAKFSWDEKQIYFSEDLFKHCYYEVDLISFINFIRIKKQI